MLVTEATALVHGAEAAAATARKTFEQGTLASDLPQSRSVAPTSTSARRFDRVR